MYLLVLAALIAEAAETTKILCLHGGGQSYTSFAASPGMVALQAAHPNVKFVFAAAPDNLWLRDAPGGKTSPTNNADWDLPSRTVLDNLVATQGPFDGLLGYSQGAAYAPAYLAHVPLGTFNFTALFCGYLTTTHLAQLARASAASPFGDIPALIWMGAADTTIPMAMTQAQTTLFTSPTVLVSQSGGHAVPDAADPTFKDVAAFLSSSSKAVPAAEKSEASLSAGAVAGIVAGSVTVAVGLVLVILKLFSAQRGASPAFLQ
jgi:predicted esterase